MRSRFARLGTVAICLVALLGMTAPPAHATSAVVLVFTGVAQTDGPMGFPCTPPTSKLCPQGFPNPLGPGGLPLVGTTNPLPLTIALGQTINSGGLPYLHGGQTRNFAFSSDICVTTGVNVLKGGKPTAHANAGCAIGAIGTISGWCRVSTGKLTGTMTDGLGQTYSLDLHWFEAGHMAIFGHWTKSNGQTGLIRGIADVTALPDFITLPTNFCHALTARTFLISGALQLVGLNL